jgi:hypothetical protein
LTWLKAADEWELRIGIRKVFWGVTESQHLVDIINQTDAVENPDGEDKLGQPMINLALIKDWGTLDLFILTSFRERTFPGPEGRLRTHPRVDTDQALYESSREERHIDVALRWSHFIGDWDVGLSHFKGTSRDPSLILSSGVLIPLYEQIQQTGVDLQATKGGWLWKLEAIHRHGQGETYNASTTGFEYSFYGVFETTADLGLVVEYLYDDRNQAATSPFQNDTMLGLRYVLNDEQSTEALLGAITDLDNHALAYSLEASRRIASNWKLNIESRFYQDIPANDPLYAFSQDDYLQIDLGYYF